MATKPVKKFQDLLLNFSQTEELEERKKIEASGWPEEILSPVLKALDIAEKDHDRVLQFADNAVVAQARHFERTTSGVTVRETPITKLNELPQVVQPYPSRWRPIYELTKEKTCLLREPFATVLIFPFLSAPQVLQPPTSHTARFHLALLAPLQIFLVLGVIRVAFPTDLDVAADFELGCHTQEHPLRGSSFFLVWRPTKEHPIAFARPSEVFLLHPTRILIRMSPPGPTPNQPKYS